MIALCGPPPAGDEGASRLPAASGEIRCPILTEPTAIHMSSSAGMDPASFINNLGNQLQAVTRSASTQQRLAGFEELFHASFDIPGLGRFVLGRFWRAFTPFKLRSARLPTSPRKQGEVNWTRSACLYRTRRDPGAICADFRRGY
jgi:hypothetical protein